MLDRVSTQIIQKSSLFRMSSSVILLSLMAGVVATNGGLGCGGSLGGECMVHSDCAGELICAYQFCHQECTSSEDCDSTGDNCFTDKEHPDVAGYCAPPVECTTNEDCNKDMDRGQFCRENTCRDSCTTDFDCTANQQCFGHVCYKKCADSQTCTGAGESCFAGKCAKSEPIESPMEVGMPCMIHSDCASLNCFDGKCVGCKADVDCAGRTCINPDPTDGASGVCSPSTMPAEETPFEELPALEVTALPVEGFGIYHATPDSKGESFYFCGSIMDQGGLNPITHGVYRVSMGVPPVKLVDMPKWETCSDILISHDDQTLYIGLGFYNNVSPYGIVKIDVNSPSLSNPEPVAWIKDYAVFAMDIHTVLDENNKKRDLIYVGARDTTNLNFHTLAGYPDDPDSYIWAKVGWNAASLAASADQVALCPHAATPTSQGYENTILTVLGTNSNTPPRWLEFNLGHVMRGPNGMAFNVEGDTLYASSYATWGGFSHIFTIDLATGAIVPRYFANGVIFGTHLRRAREKNIFSWISMDHNNVDKLNIFEL